MSKAPGDDVKIYDGSGDWFKIGETGVCNEGGDFTKDAWCTWDKNTLTATIPSDIPSGEYLMRFEHIGKPFLDELALHHVVQTVSNTDQASTSRL